MSVILTDPGFHDEDAARAHLESIRWPTGPFCRSGQSGEPAIRHWISTLCVACVGYCFGGGAGMWEESTDFFTTEAQRRRVSLVFDWVIDFSRNESIHYT
jgi:hypothetical protein